ncbi:MULTISPECIES: hypothetical protein [unclassified Actinopolyspora]|uniref:hypothetical protein n=1 Tax=Actinopolyspora TaxID=1849 RepID=UPI0013F64FB6|nr:MULTISPECIES: hypothetical protein [unclassified Actinopolyspora]NHD17472.1 hypothetical protein [Actinopolyspora sp. BKK2]NHE76795.1 hypothetical protein [Actinopolyspora sp. BKK1]
MNSLAVFVMVATGTTSSIVTALVAMSWVEQRWVGTVPFTPTRVGEIPTADRPPAAAGSEPESCSSEPVGSGSVPPEPSGERAGPPLSAAVRRTGRAAAGRSTSAPTDDVRGLAWSGACVAVVLVCVLTQRAVRSPVRARR